MTNRKKPAIIPGSDKDKHYAISAGGVAGSSSDIHGCSKADPETSSSERLLDNEAPKTDRFAGKRKARRFLVCSPATIRWLGSDGMIHEASGTVRDISTGGLFVEAAVSLKMTSNVELEITPFGMQSDSPKTELHFEGKIVRIERADRCGFAVAGFLWLAKLGVRIS